MELYLLRHADAEEPGSAYKTDSERPLTARGRKQSREVGKGLRALELSFDLILSSPYFRARQTAEIVAGAIGAEDRLQTTEHLAPDGNPRRLVGDLKKHAARMTSVLLVGHEPYLGRIISTLLAGTAEVSVTMKKAGLCKLTVDSPRYGRCATLEWLATPKLIAR